MTGPIAISLRFSPRARRISLRARGDEGVVVVVPPHTSRRRIEQVLRGHQSWVGSRLTEQAQRRAVWEDLLRGSGVVRIELMGKPVTIRNAGGGVVDRVLRQNDEILVPSNVKDPGCLRDMVGRWVHHVALEVLPQRVSELSGRHGFSFSRVMVRDQSTRWGSCSRKGNLSFNWRLVMMPPEVMDYLILHELAHTREMNHSPLFWGLVARLVPEYSGAEQWLRTKGRTLFW